MECFGHKGDTSLLSFFEYFAWRCFNAGFNEIGATNKISNKACFGVTINFFRLAQLFNPAIIHDHNQVTERHCFRLVVRDVDAEDIQAALETMNLTPHLHTQLGVQVGKRFIE